MENPTQPLLTQRLLYLYNRERIQDPISHDSRYLAFERDWIDRRLVECGGMPSLGGLADLQRQLRELIEAEQRDLPESAHYVGQTMPLNEFRVLVQEFAIDGLTEAQVFYYILPRLTLSAQMPMLRIMIDEFGSGNLKRAHTSLYVQLLRELGMPTEVDFYVNEIEADCFEFVNLFYWLTLRADDPSYFAGAITYLETAIPSFFECYELACHRLGIAAHAYYSEHRHIDRFHAQEGLRLLRAMDGAGQLQPDKAWAGMRLASWITALAFEAAVAKARTFRGKDYSLRGVA